MKILYLFLLSLLLLGSAWICAAIYPVISIKLWWQRKFLSWPLCLLPEWIQNILNPHHASKIMLRVKNFIKKLWDDQSVLKNRPMGLVLHFDSKDDQICDQKIFGTSNRALTFLEIDLTWFFYPMGFLLSAHIDDFEKISSLFPLLSVYREKSVVDHITFAIPIYFFFLPPEQQNIWIHQIKNTISVLCTTSSIATLPVFIVITQTDTLIGFDNFIRILPTEYHDAIIGIQTEGPITDPVQSILWEKNIDTTLENIECLYRQYSIQNNNIDQNPAISTENFYQNSLFISQYSELCAVCKKILAILYDENDPLTCAQFYGFFISNDKLFLKDFFKNYLFNTSFNATKKETLTSSLESKLKKNKKFIIIVCFILLLIQGFFSYRRHDKNINFIKKTVTQLWVQQKSKNGKISMSQEQMKLIHNELTKFNAPITKNPLYQTPLSLIFNPYQNLTQEWCYAYNIIIFIPEKKKSLESWLRKIVDHQNTQPCDAESIIQWLEEVKIFQEQNKWFTIWTSNNAALIQAAYPDAYVWSNQTINMIDIKLKKEIALYTERNMAIQHEISVVFLKKYESWQGIIWNTHPIKEAIQNFYALYHPFYNKQNNQMSLQTMLRMRDGIKILNNHIQDYQQWLDNMNTRNNAIILLIQNIIPETLPYAQNIYTTLVENNNSMWLEQYTAHPLPLIEFVNKNHGHEHENKSPVELSLIAQSMLGILNWVSIFNIEDKINKISPDQALSALVPKIYELLCEAGNIFYTDNKVDVVFEQWKDNIKRSFFVHVDEIVSKWAKDIIIKDYIIQYDDNLVSYNEEDLILLKKMYDFCRQNELTKTCELFDRIMNTIVNSLSENAIKILNEILYTDMKTTSFMYPPMGFMLGGAFGWAHVDDAAAIIQKKRSDLDKLCQKVLIPLLVLIKKLPIHHSKILPKWKILDIVVKDMQLYQENKSVSEWGHFEKWFNQLTLLSVLDPIPAHKIQTNSWLYHWVQDLVRSIQIGKSKWAPVQQKKIKNTAVQPVIHLWNSSLNGFFPFCDHQSKAPHKGFSSTEDAKQWWIRIQQIPEKVWPTKQNDLRWISWFFDTWCTARENIQWQFSCTPNPSVLGWNLTTSFQTDGNIDFKHFVWTLLETDPISIEWTPGQSLMLSLNMANFDHLDKAIDQPWVTHNTNILKFELNNPWAMLNLCSLYGTPEDTVRIPLCFYDRVGKRYNTYIVFKITVTLKNKTAVSWYRLLSHMTDVSFLQDASYVDYDVKDQEIVELLKKNNM